MHGFIQLSAGQWWHLYLQPGSVGEGNGKPGLGIVAGHCGIQLLLNMSTICVASGSFENLNPGTFSSQ